MLNLFHLILVSFLFITGTEISAKSTADVYQAKKIIYLDIDGAIGPYTKSSLEKAIEKADDQSLIIMTLSTPGGLISTTKDILKIMGNSPCPIVIWVTPSGASATSAGAIISMGAHLLFMNEGTNIGAATPVQLGKDIEQDDLRRKAINDIVALGKDLNRKNLRNPKAFPPLVEIGESITSKVAKERGLINDIANSKAELLEKIPQYQVRHKGITYNLVLENPVEVTIEKSFVDLFLQFIANPQTAYILFIVGAALIYLEFQAPGGLVAGGLGAIALLLAAIGMQLLPLNLGAFALLILSFVLFLVEAYVTSYGLLSAAGILSLLFGSMFLFQTPDSYISVARPLIYATVAAISLFLLFIGFFLVNDVKKGRKRQAKKGDPESAIVLQELQTAEEGHLYQVKVNGEIWKCFSSKPLEINSSVLVSKGQYEMNYQAQDNKGE